MKLIVVAIALAACAVTAEDKKENEKDKKYTDKFDSIDLEAVLQNKRLLTAYTKCVLDQGKCTPEGKELKSHVNEALQNGCAKCTRPQRESMKKVIKHFIVNDPDSWEKLIEKYDPDRIYTSKYEKELRKLDSKNKNE